MNEATEGQISLSVVIPAFDSERTIARTVDSILGQSDGEVEVIVVDDGSRVDPSLALASQVVSGRCRVVRQTNSGASVARNRGFRLARASHVMFVDADDELVQGNLLPFVAAARHSGADITISDFYLRRGERQNHVRAVNSETMDFDSSHRTVFQWLILARNGFDGEINVGLLGAPWAKVYRKDFLLAAFGREEVFTPGVPRGQDVLFNVEAFGKANSVHYFREASYIYSVSPESSSHRVTGDFVERVAILVASVQGVLLRESWDLLRPALAKMTITLLDEALQRRGRALTRRDALQLLRSDVFRNAIVEARWRDFSRPGRVKLAAFRLGSVPTLAVTKLIGLIGRRALDA